MNNELIETFYPTSRLEWRRWLEENHNKKNSIWLIRNKKKSNLKIVDWSELVDEALCFGWIDSIAKPIDENIFMQFFSKRNPESTWSKINKDKVQQLINDGLMTKAGFESIEIAKQNGSWILLDDVEKLIIPGDLDIAFKEQIGSKDYFLSLSKSIKKMMLQWIVLAKRAETRKSRIDNIVSNSFKKQIPKQFRSVKK